MIYGSKIDGILKCYSVKVIALTYSTNKSATYTYDAEGNKLRVVYTNPSSTIDYCGNMIYEGGTLKQILVDGGYVTLNGTTPVYHYYLQDHLGNNRVVCNASGTVEQVNHYYPFGGLFGQSTNGDTQRYKYNGKELDRMHGLDWYDYGARHMAPDVSRFTTIDPMTEKYYNMSPYAYCSNNPMNRIDPDGRSTWVIYQGKGQYKIVGGNLYDKDRGIYEGYFNDQHIFVPKHSIGISSSITSFYNSDLGGGWQTQSIINVNDRSGNRFLSQIIGSKPPMFDDYIMNARNSQPYDFKVTNGNGENYGKDMFYRGMPIGITKGGQTIYSSARDIGNMAAGYVAAINGMSWEASRIAFDVYQGGIEGASTRNAEYYGWKMGYNNSSTNQKADNLVRSFCSMLKSIWNYIFK